MAVKAWKKNYIENCSDDLIENLFWNSSMKASLRKWKIFGSADVDKIESIASSFDKNYAVANLIISKLDVHYELFMDILNDRSIRQTGAFEILKKGLMDNDQEAYKKYKAGKPYERGQEEAPQDVAETDVVDSIPRPNDFQPAVIDGSKDDKNLTGTMSFSFCGFKFENVPVPNSWMFRIGAISTIASIVIYQQYYGQLFAHETK